MTECEKIVLTEFDIATCGTSLQLLKAYLPYTDCSTQRLLAIMIRFIELTQTFQFYDGLTHSPLNKSADSPEQVIRDISRFCPPKDAEMLNTISVFSKINAMKDNMYSAFMDDDQQKKYASYKSILDNLKL